MNAEISTHIRLRGLSQVMSSGKPRAPGPAQKCLFGSQQYLAQGKDVITGERDENRRTRAPGVSTEGSVPAGEAAPEGEGKRECGGAGSQEEGSFISTNSAVISGVLGGLILCFCMQNSYAAIGNPHQPLWRTDTPLAPTAGLFPSTQRLSGEGIKPQKATEERGPNLPSLYLPYPLRSKDSL